MMRHKPMLAYPASNKPIDYTKKVFIQPKLDGVRCLIQREPAFPGRPDLASFNVKAYSRTGKEWKNIDHILQSLKPFFFYNPDVVLDGELYNHDLKNDFETIISLVRRQKPDDIDMLESADMVQFHCYDCINIGLIDASFENRMNFIAHHVPHNYCVKHVTTDRVYKHEEALDIHHNANLANGYEGSILRTNDPYACKRSHNLRKFKDFHDTEATITGWVEGKGKRKGTIGKFLAIDADGIEFGMPVMDKFKYLQDNFKLMQSYVGKIATFTYFERTKANSYRHPLFKCIRDYE